MLIVVICGIAAGLAIKTTVYFLAACGIVSLFYGFSHASTFASRHSDRTDIEEKNRNSAIFAAFINAYIIALIASLACGSIARLFI